MKGVEFYDESQEAVQDKVCVVVVKASKWKRQKPEGDPVGSSATLALARSAPFAMVDHAAKPDLHMTFLLQSASASFFTIKQASWA